jgi:hypothetical protein
MSTERLPTTKAPVETTAEIGDPPLAPKTYAIEIAPGTIYVGGHGEFETQAYRELEPYEVDQLLYVFPYLFQDMEYEWKQVKGQ